MKRIALLGLLMMLPVVAAGQSIEGPDEVKTHAIAWYNFEGLKPNQSVGVFTVGRDWLLWGPPKLSPEWVMFHAEEEGTYTIDAGVMWLENGMVKWMPISKKVTVTGGGVSPIDPPVPPLPPPPPPPPPNPTGKWQVMFFTDKTLEDNWPDSLTVGVINSKMFREELEAAGNSFKGCFNVSAEAQSAWPEKLESGCYYSNSGRKVCGPHFVKQPPPELPRAWWDAVRGDPMPRIALAPLQGGDILDFKLPETKAGVLKLMEDQQ